MSGPDIGVDEIRDHARRSALAGRPIYANPHLGDDATMWRDAYREVPEAERGSQPELLTSFRTIHARARKSSRSARPFGMAIAAAVEEAEARS
jgi:hypothetical protein